MLKGIKPKTQLMIDSVIFVLFVVVLISGLVLFFGPEGGYRGGRNPAAQYTFLLLARNTWKDVHNWAGLAMGAMVVLHLTLHIPWIVCQVERLSARSSKSRAHLQTKECDVITYQA